MNSVSDIIRELEKYSAGAPPHLKSDAARAITAVENVLQRAQEAMSALSYGCLYETTHDWWRTKTRAETIPHLHAAIHKCNGGQDT